METKTFSEVNHSELFRFQNILYRRIDPIYQSCCTIKFNAQVETTGANVKFNDSDVVEVVVVEQ